MTTYKKMNTSQMAEFIIQAPFDKEFYFADTWDEEKQDGDLDNSCCEGWYGFKKIHALDSNIVVFGWSGGGSNWCTEVNSEYLESDIAMYLKDYVEGTTQEGCVVLEVEEVA